ncbi:MAG: sulfatase-like hydrolase/transferase [Halobacteriaceae archaeon]
MPPSTPDEVENVLFVMTDQQRVDSLGCYGNDTVETPNVDGIAERGARFDRAYTPAAICGPARAALVSGVRPHRNGVLRNVEESEGPPLSERFPCYPQLLGDAGWNAGLAGKWHVGEHPREFGLDGAHYPGWHQTLDHPDYNAYLDERGLPRFDGDALEDVFPGEGERYQEGATDPRPVEASFPYFVAERAIEQLEAYAEDDSPFYESVHFFGPHNPYYLPREYRHMYDPDDVELPESAVKETFQGKPAAHLAQRHFSNLESLAVADWRRYIATYWGFVSLIDDQLGRLVGALDELGVREETAVVFTSDHGAFLTAHKLHDKGPAMYEDIYNVPLVAEGLGVGGAREEFVSLLDLPPTVLDWAGADVPDTYDGRSLLELPGEWREDITAEFHGHFFPIEQRMLRTDRYKLVYNERDRWELYDLAEDPHELENRIDDPAYGEVAARMYLRLEDRLDEFGDDALAPDERKLTNVEDVWDPE